LDHVLPFLDQDPPKEEPPTDGGCAKSRRIVDPAYILPKSGEDYQ
jgi:hypothetical protein